MPYRQLTQRAALTAAERGTQVAVVCEAQRWDEREDGGGGGGLSGGRVTEQEKEER